jgi:hypothetical protein
VVNPGVLKFTIDVYNVRNLSLVVDEKQCRSMVGQDIMTPLSVMIRDCLAKLDQIRVKKYSPASDEEERGGTEGATMCMSEEIGGATVSMSEEIGGAVSMSEERGETGGVVSISAEGGEKKGAMSLLAKAKLRRLRTEIEEEQWSEALEQGLHLLWNVT